MQDLGFTLRVARSDTGTLHVRLDEVPDDVDTSVAVKACDEIQRCLDDYPGWHDKPTGAGKWVFMDKDPLSQDMFVTRIVGEGPFETLYPEMICYGPIPEDTER